MERKSDQYKTARHSAALFALLSLMICSLAGCTEYWWSRGQAPTPRQLLVSSEKALEDSVRDYAHDKIELSDFALALSQELRQTSDALESLKDARTMRTHFLALVESFIEMEGKLTPTSRAPYAELSGQLRRMVSVVSRGGRIDHLSFQLFSARTNFFLARELSFPI